MSTPQQDPAGDAPAPRFDDPTRDIRLPSLPDRPQAVVRPEWRAHVQPAVPDPSPSPRSPAPAEQHESGTADATDVTTAAQPARSPDPAPPRPYVLPNEPTDELSSPSRVRQQTLAFDAAAAGTPAPGVPHVQGSAAPGQASPQFGAPPFGPPYYGPPGRGSAPDRTRRWPWVVLTVLPILVIVAAGLLLIFLLRGV